MPEYQYVNDRTGKRITLVLKMSDAIPEKFTKGGRVYRREYTVPGAKVPETSFTSHQFPQRYKYHDRFDAKGNCVFTSKKHREETMARANDHGEGVQWDG